MQKQPQQLFQGSCALFCALLEFSRIFALRISLSKVAKKALKSYDFKAFSWSEWRDLNSSIGKKGCDTPYFFVLICAVYRTFS